MSDQGPVWIERVLMDLWRRQRGLLLSLLLWVVLVSAGCGSDSDYFGKVLPPKGQVLRFNNGAEPEYLDPQMMTGQPDGRIAWALFEGLTSYDPKDLTPLPGMAESWEISEDGRVYLFHLRKNARWSNGDPLTAHDFVYSWRRFLNPATAAQYAYLLFGVRHGKAYCTGEWIGRFWATELRRRGSSKPEVIWQPATEASQQSDKGDSRAEITLSPVLDAEEKPTGVLRGDLLLEVPWAKGRLQGSLEIAKTGEATGSVTGKWVLDGGDPVSLEFNVSGVLDRNDREKKVSGTIRAEAGGLQWTARLEARVARAEDVGVSALDDRTLRVELDNPIQYFLSLTAFYPLSPVHPATIEKYGERWATPERMVSNGAFRLVEHSLQNRIVMVRSETYWDGENVKLEKVIAYPVELYTTGCDLYKAGEIDIEPSNYIPLEFIPRIKTKKDYAIHPYLGTYFYRINVNHPVLKDKRVRRALAFSVDREAMVRFLRAGQLPAWYFVPDGIPRYKSPRLLRFDVKEAKRLLAEAGYPGGKGFPKLSILYNTTEQHKQIAVIMQRMWKKNLGIDIGLKNQEWKVYLKSQRSLDYEISRSGWIGDYADPNTFLDMFLTGGGNNNTGWSNRRYDELIAMAARESDPQRRMQIFYEAEEILMDELPIIPLYIYTTFYLKKPYVRGYTSNIQDVHPLKYVWIDHDWRAKE